MILIESSAWNNWFASPLSKALQYCIWCRSPVSTALGEWESWVIIKWKRGLVEVLSPQNSLESSFLELVLVPLKQKKTCTENFHVKEVIHFMHIVFFSRWKYARKMMCNIFWNIPQTRNTASIKFLLYNIDLLNKDASYRCNC